jgi:hypothetical protein
MPRLEASTYGAISRTAQRGAAHRRQANQPANAESVIRRRVRVHVLDLHQVDDVELLAAQRLAARAAMAPVP